MKTTDLIPILLYELKNGDKYGLELIQACNGYNIDIKQPSLYSILKKLEKSHFISSYWKDSDIGGKRHYYKITENGLFQLETYPPIEELVQNAVLNDNKEENDINNDSVVAKHDEKENINNQTPFDNIELNFSSSNSNFKQEQSNPFDNFLEQSPIPNNKDYSQMSPNSEESLNNFDEENVDIINDLAETDKINEEQDEIEEEISTHDLTDYDLKNADFNNFDEHSVVEEYSEDESSVNIEQPVVNSNEGLNNSSFSIFDALNYADEEDLEDDKDLKKEEIPALNLNNPFFKPKEEKNLSEKSNLEINEDNIKLLDNDNKTEDFAESVKVSSFTQKQIQPIEISREKTIKEVANEIGDSPAIDNSNIEFKDFIDLKTNKNIKQAKSLAKIKISKTIISSLATLALMLLTSLICFKHDITFIYGVTLVLSTLYIVLYCSYVIGRYNDFVLKYSVKKFNYNFKRQIIIRAVCVGVLIVLLFALNLIFFDFKIFKIENFGNFFAPIIISLTCFIDYLLSWAFYRFIK